MGSHEVTQREFESAMGSNPSFFKGEMLPVDKVSFLQAAAFCKAITIRDRKAGRITGNMIYRLPTEAEWEYACLAGATTAFSFGDLAKETDAYLWSAENSEDKTNPVSQKKPNAWGLYDMHGNVWEWCSDWYINSYTNAETTDPQGPSSGTARVLRGGVWGYGPRICRSASRNSTFNCRYYGDWGGFRVVLSVSSMDD